LSVQIQPANAIASQQVTTVKPFQIRGRFFTGVALQITGKPDRAFLEALDQKIGQTRQFFSNAPLVVDLAQAQGLDDSAALCELVAALRGRDLSVFAVQNASPAQIAAAATAGLINLPDGKNVPLERVSSSRSAAAVKSAVADLQPATPAPVAARVITQPVRSGQTIYAEHGDLVIIGPVSSGAEVIAAGNVHIYGRLRGRALAGVNGDGAARIFCQALDAELLAINGLYLTSDDLGPDTPRQNVQIYLEDDKLKVASLT
jgi:septum site-determining protein MinC